MSCGIPRDNLTRYYKTVVTRGDRPFRIKSNVAFERWRANKCPRGAVNPRRLSRLSFRGNLCPFEDHLRTTPPSMPPAWLGVVWRGAVARYDCLSRVSNPYFMPILPADAPGFQRRILPFTYPACLSQPDRNDYGTARPPFAVIPSRIDSWHRTQPTVLISVSFLFEITAIARTNDLINPRSPPGKRI